MSSVRWYEAIANAYLSRRRRVRIQLQTRKPETGINFIVSPQ